MSRRTDRKDNDDKNIIIKFICLQTYTGQLIKRTNHYTQYSFNAPLP